MNPAVQTEDPLDGDAGTPDGGGHPVEVTSGLGVEQRHVLARQAAARSTIRSARRAGEGPLERMISEIVPHRRQSIKAVDWLAQLRIT